ncbi:Glycerol-3-phosphate dehydrogenase [NAD(+)], cytoplasmic, partial [Habropoda laboriosa]
GSAIAKIVGANAARLGNFEDRVTMYVYEEMINGKKLTEIINETHENVKYLPGHKLPPNVVAVPDVVEAAKDADILIFVIPHQFINKICATLLGKIKSTAVGLSFIRGYLKYTGFDKKEGGGIELISHIISKQLHIPVSVLMGANLASEVAEEMFCETTIGCKDKTMAPVLRDIIQTPYFRVVVVEDVDSVECCGALKNIVACGAGFVDGLGLGDNTKAAVIRLGLMEMIKFVDVVFPGGKLATFFESCGVADLITTCYGGRNRRVSEAFVKTGKRVESSAVSKLTGQHLAETEAYSQSSDTVILEPRIQTGGHCVRTYSVEQRHLTSCSRANFPSRGSPTMRLRWSRSSCVETIEELEKEMLNGQKLQGPFTAEEVNYMLKARNMESRFPLFTAIHRICVGEIKATELIPCIRNHPEHM